ncbi:MAG: hypothetical protein HYX48_07735 [Chlamydiales bacterium]|nr:hypothetical protein [Chlamydiales bacterium]
MSTAGLGVADIVPFLNGLGSGIMMTETKRLEDSVHAGGNGYFTAMLQMGQAGQALGFVDKALQITGHEAVPQALCYAIYLTPILLALATSEMFGVSDETLKAIIVFAQDYLGTLCHVAAMVSSVVQIYFGSMVFGVTAAVVLGVGFLDRNGVLPEYVRQVVHLISAPIMIATGLMSGQVFDTCFAGFNLVCFFIQKYFSWSEVKMPDPNLTEGLLTPSTLKDIVQRSRMEWDFGLERYVFMPPRNLHMNRKYVHCKTSLDNVPNVDIAGLKAEFDRINWSEENIQLMRQKLGADQRYLGRNTDPMKRDESTGEYLLSDAKLVEHVKKCLASCVDGVKGHKILNGEPLSYDLLEDYLKTVVHEIARKPEEERMDLLLLIAVEGGEYCGPGIFDAAEAAFVRCVGESDLFSVRKKVLTSLQSQRNRDFEGLYAVMMNLQGNDQIPNPMIGLMGNVVDWHDRHNKNIVINMYGGDLGLRKAGADNDQLAVIDPLMKMGVSLTLAPLIQTIFWGEDPGMMRGHTLSSMVETLQETSGTPELPFPDITQWWLDWIDKQEAIDLNEWRGWASQQDWEGSERTLAKTKELLKAELTDDAKIFGMPVQRRRDDGGLGKVEPGFIAAMLFDMGILHNPNAV